MLKFCLKFNEMSHQHQSNIATFHLINIKKIKNFKIYIYFLKNRGHPFGHLGVVSTTHLAHWERLGHPMEPRVGREIVKPSGATCDFFCWLGDFLSSDMVFYFFLN
jgi:hypothetical protein